MKEVIRGWMNLVWQISRICETFFVSSLLIFSASRDRCESVPFLNVADCMLFFVDSLRIWFLRFWFCSWVRIFLCFVIIFEIFGTGSSRCYGLTKFEVRDTNYVGKKWNNLKSCEIYRLFFSNNWNSNNVAYSGFIIFL